MKETKKKNEVVETEATEEKAEKKSKKSVAGTSVKPKRERKPLNKRKLKHGSFATAMTVLFVAAVVLVNIITTMLFDRFPITIDLTGDSIYSVSDETIEYIENITSPVEITVMATEDEYRSISDYSVQCAELLDKYTQYNSLITVTYKDLNSNPDFVANYSQALETGDIIIELGNGEHTRVKVVSLCDIIEVVEDYETYLSQYESYYGALYTHQMFYSYGLITGSIAEQAITSAVMTVTDANPITVATLTYPGADESDVSGLTDLLDKNGYIVTEINIQTEEIDEDVDLIIIPAPKIDYTTAEISKIETWLYNNGELEKDLLYVASVEQAETPNLDALLYKYGLTVEYKVIYETDTNYYSGYQNRTFQSMVSEDYSADIANPYLSLYVPDSRAVSTRFDDGDGYYTCQILVQTSENAVLKDMYDTSDDWTTDDATERGSFYSVAMGVYKVLNQDTHISGYTHVIAVGSDQMLLSTLMSSSQFNNGDFFISLLNEITEKTEGITITSKTVQASGVVVTESVENGLNVAFAVVIPVITIIIGIVVWVRRRHR
ncbi:MAG: GldG family protein [Oscillospiraceae bacterium]|nr:GldG family protein [Oscillospiraceae bacterium]